MNESLRLRNSMEKSRIKVILFDLDNTLIDTAGAGRIAIQKVGYRRESTNLQFHLLLVCRLNGASERNFLFEEAWFQAISLTGRGVDYLTRHISSLVKDKGLSILMF